MTALSRPRVLQKVDFRAVFFTCDALFRTGASKKYWLSAVDVNPAFLKITIVKFAGVCLKSTSSKKELQPLLAVEQAMYLSKMLGFLR